MKIKDAPRGERPKRERGMLRCPQCGSTELYYETGMITGHKYHCKKCQYIGALVIQDEKENGPGG